jgi:two-component system sensor histidine kinase VicK
MKGYSQMLRRKLIDDPEGQRFAASIDAQVSRLSRLVDDLLDVTRFARGQFELARRKVDLRPILEETVNRFRVISQRHDLALDIGAGSYIGHWDRDRLEQVLNNLLSNAIKYSPQGGTVTVGAHHEDGHVVVFVRDEGVGIPEADQQHLFERFYRGVNEMHDVKGLGLGLYVTQRVIDAHGGQVRVRSKEGEGSEFSFTLPVTETPQPALTSPGTESV